MKYLLKCITCGHETGPDPRASTCPKCGPFQGTFDVVYPLNELKFESLSWLDPAQSVFFSLIDIFPFGDISNLPPIPVGQTPMYKSKALARTAGMENLWLKDDGRNPSASLKDRASAVAIAMACEARATVIATASTGNAASSLATLAAATPLKTVVFVPKNAPRPKLLQIMIHGAYIVKLNCDYDTAFDLCSEICHKFGWYNRNTAVNPYTGEGKKSAALEIARDLGFAPDAVVCPVGDGCIIGGLYKGFTDLKGLGLISQIPRLYGVQAAGASPLASAYASGTAIAPWKHPHTIADSIAVGYPRDGVKAMRAVKNSGGSFLAVSDEEIMAAQRLLAQNGGIFAEPAAAAAMAGAVRLRDDGQIRRNENVVVLLTGHGLKDIASASKNVSADPEAIAPDIDSVEKALGELLT